MKFWSQENHLEIGDVPSHDSQRVNTGPYSFPVDFPSHPLAMRCPLRPSVVARTFPVRAGEVCQDKWTLWPTQLPFGSGGQKPSRNSVDGFSFWCDLWMNIYKFQLFWCEWKGYRWVQGLDMFGPNDPHMSMNQISLSWVSEIGGFSWICDAKQDRKQSVPYCTSKTQ